MRNSFHSRYLASGLSLHVALSRDTANQTSKWEMSLFIDLNEKQLVNLAIDRPLVGDRSTSAMLMDRMVHYCLQNNRRKFTFNQSTRLIVP